MDWANVKKKCLLPHLPNAIPPPPPHEHALYKYNFLIGNAFSRPQRPRSF